VAIDKALDPAIVTPPAHWQPGGIMRLDAILARIVSAAAGT
jgi:hypothetical protein